MIFLISGTSHTGKTALSQKILEKYKYPYMSIDHLKMGLIRSGNTDLTPLDSDKVLTDYLWPIIKEIIKTAIENEQNLTVEGCYIPFDWQKDFEEKYLEQIKYCCIIMTEKYIKNNFEDIKNYADVIEKRLCDDLEIEELLQDNKYNLEQCKKYGLEYILIDEYYEVETYF